MSEEKAKTIDQKTIDGFTNFVSRLGVRNDNTLSAGFYAFNLLTRNRIQLEAGYRGSWIVGQMIDTIAEDMTKAGINITTNEGNEDINDLQAHLQRKGVHSSLCNTIKWGRLYGGAIGVIQIDGQNLATPLDISTVGQDQFLGIVPYDRWQLNPVLENLIQSGPDMGLPTYYDIVTSADSTDPTAKTATGQIRVHHTRCIRMIGIQLPFFQAITEMMWGESVLERLWDRLISFDSATMSAANLIERANNRTIQVENMRELVSNGGPAYEGFIAYMEEIRRFQTNEGLTLLDKEDVTSSTSYSFSGLPELLLQFGQQLAGACGIPLVRLFGQSPAGLSATGDSDLRTYYDNINSQQNTQLGNAWDKILKIMWRSTYGKAAPADLQFTFVPLWQMSDADKSAIAKANTDTLIEAADAGLIKRSTAMKELRDKSGDTGLFSNISDEDIAEAEDMDDQPPPPAATGAEEDIPTPKPTPSVPPTIVPKVKLKDSAITKIKKWVGLG